MKNYLSRTAVVLVVLLIGACAEAKIGMGPFKAGSVEVGPGGVEAKGPIQPGKKRGPED